MTTDAFGNLTPIKPDFTEPWVRGEEHLSQGGGGEFWQKLREDRGWSREDVWQLSDGMLDPATLALIEEDYGVGGVWEIQQLITMAVLYGRSPGALLDEWYESKGRELIAEDED